MDGFKTIGLISKTDDHNISFALTSLVQYLTEQQYRVYIYDESQKFLVTKFGGVQLFDAALITTGSMAEVVRHSDLVISLGGDGTMLTVAKLAAMHKVPIVGINLGNLGFLADLSRANYLTELRKILNGEYVKEERRILHTKVVRDGKPFDVRQAANEVVIHRWVTPSAIDITTHIDGKFLNTQKTDGLVIATPTGSTAYALSGGGPIIHPSINALVLVPLNPHTLSNRPIVVSGESNIVVTFNQSKQIRALVTCDHAEIPDVYRGDEIHISQSQRTYTILHPIGYDFYQTLRTKLNWS